MSNLSILERNTLHGLSDDAADLYLRGCARGEQRALYMATEWGAISERIAPMIKAGVNAHGMTDDHGVALFIRERHFRRYFPDGRVA
jgi:hypothetical protein